MEERRSGHDGSSGGLEDALLVIQADIAALAIGGFSAFALILWDFICYLPDGIKLLKDFRKVEWRCPDPWSFFLVRYSALSFAVASLFNLSLKSSQCQLASATAQALSICVVAATGVLALRRTVSLWESKPIIIGLSTTLYVLMLASWIAVATQQRSLEVETSLPFGTNCWLRPATSWSPISYGSSSIFFSAVFFLSLARLTRQRTDRVLNLGLTPLNRACLWYLMVNSVASWSLLIIFSSPSMSQIARRTAAPFFVLVVAAMGQRIFLNSRADYILRKMHLQEIATSHKAKQPSIPGIPRWSWVPVRKMSVSASRAVKPAIPSYRKPPPPHPSVPDFNLMTLNPIPKQHQGGKHDNLSFSSSSSMDKSTDYSYTIASPNSFLSGKSLATSEADVESSVHFATSPITSSSTNTTFGHSRSGSNPVSPMTFGSPPPGSPPVLGLPLPGRRPPPSGRSYHNNAKSSKKIHALTGSSVVLTPKTPTSMLGSLGSDSGPAKSHAPRRDYSMSSKWLA